MIQTSRVIHFIFSLYLVFSLFFQNALALNPVETFANYHWSGKDSGDECVGPGPSLFSADPDSTYVNEYGHLFLSVREKNDKWYSSEIVGSHTLGYGTYEFSVIDASNTFLDPSIIL
eukprot:Awhi_evm1s11106